AEGLGEAQRGFVGELVVEDLGHAAGGDASAEETRIVSAKVVGEAVDVEKIGDDQLAELGVPLGRGAAIDHEHVLDGGAVEALEEHAFADHTGGAGENDPEVIWYRHCTGGEDAVIID